MRQDAHDSLQEVFERLELRGCRPQWAKPNVIRAHCPAHDDKRPSLYITANDGKLLFKCFAGCPYEAIIAQIGPLQRRPSHGDNNPTRPSVFSTSEAAIKAYGFGEPSHRWTYFRPGESTPAFYVCRWNRPDGKEIRPVCKVEGGWKQGYPEDLRPLWNLPAIEKAPLESWLVVCEGELAAEAAGECGLLATTSAGGANAAAKTDWKPVKGRQVLILPDNDTPGRKYAEDVAKLCWEAGAVCVKVLDLAEWAPELPEGGDIVDLLASPNFCGLPLSEGATPEDLGAWILAKAAELPEADLGQSDTPEAATEDEPQWIPLPWEPYPVECLPSSLAKYVQAVADCLGCDPSQVALPLIVVMASAIGTTRVVRVKEGWEVFAILWGAVIGESGTLKTPAYQKAIVFAQHYQHRLAESYEQECRTYETKLLDYETRLAKWKRNPDSEEPPEKPPKPICRRVVTNDATIEALALLLRDNPRGLLVACDELSTWFGSFGRYSRTGSREAEVGQWVSLYHGQPLNIDRKTSGFVHVPMAAVSIVGLIQPRVLREVLDSFHLENGLAARFLFIRPPTQIKRWTDKELNPQVVTPVENVFSRLYGLTHVLTPEGKPVPTRVELCPEAREAFKAFYNHHNETAAEFTGDFRSALAKLEELPLRLALTIHLGRWADGETVNPDFIDLESMQRAIRLTQWHVRETQRFYEWIHELTIDSQDQRVLEWIRKKGGEVTPRDLARGIWQFRGKTDEAEAVLQRLVEARCGTWENIPSSQKGGKPKRVFRVRDVHRHRHNLENSGDFGGYVDVDVGKVPAQQAEMASSPQVIPPERGALTVDNFSTTEASPKPGEFGQWRL